MNSTVDLTAEGRFSIGCNYWASHAGTNMWSNWQPEIVAADLKQLSSEAGLQVLRVFPLWPDFQPLKMHFGGNGNRNEMRLGEEPLGNDELGRAGIAKEMMERFAFLIDEAERNGLKLVVSLLTGWMSGRLFVPEAFANINVLTDPYAIKWERKFVRAFVRHFKGRKGIIAWELGNECNCMGQVNSTEEAYLWASAIADAVKREDSSRPFISGMHSLEAEPLRRKWTIEDQADICDILTTHPYPLFTPHCPLDPIDEMRNGLHATAESRLYGDVGGKPCIVEEVGTLGPAFCSDEVAANYAEMSLMSSLAHQCRSFIWWCAYDQNQLAFSPYEWTSLERYLGIFRANREPKPLVKAFNSFRKFNALLPKLPPRARDAVCILSKDQDCWGAGFASFILAKQAGFDIEFQKASQPLKKAPLYLLPSVRDANFMTRAQWLGLLAEVKAGSELYISIDDALLAPLEEFAGLKVLRRSARSSEAKFQLDCIPDAELSCASPYRLELEPQGANVLGRENDGNPCFGSFKLGKGTVHFLSLPLEMELVKKPGSFHGETMQPFWRLYKQLAGNATAGRALDKDAPQLGITEHHESENSRIAFLINYSSQAGCFDIALKNGWKLAETIWGDAPSASNAALKAKMPANSSLVLLLVR